MKPFKLVVVDDHALFRAGLISLLQDFEEFEVVGDAENGLRALAVIRHTAPDVVLLDVNMPEMGGVDTVLELKKWEAPPHILMLTISQNQYDLLGAIRAGADGYLLKNAEPDDLKKAIYDVMDGKAVLSPGITRQVMQAVSNERAALSSAVLLSPREIEVLACLANGNSSSEIAGELFISKNTVKTHIRHILEKLEAANRVEAVTKAIQKGLL